MPNQNTSPWNDKTSDALRAQIEVFDTWQDVATAFRKATGLPLTPDAARKKAVRMGWSLRARTIPPSEPYRHPDRREIVEKDVQIQRLKATVKDLRADHRAALDTIADLGTKVDLIDRLEKKPRPKVLRGSGKKSVSRKRTGASAVLCLSDWHLGKVTRPENVDGLNKYDSAEAVLRIQNCAENALAMIEQERRLAAIDSLTVLCLGDMIDGGLHDDSECDMVINDQVEAMEDRLDWTVRTMLMRGKFRNGISVRCHVGNHGRQTQKIPYAFLYRRSFEAIGYRHLAKLYRSEPRVRFDVPQQYSATWDCEGMTFESEHGHTIKGGSGIGGMSSAVSLALGKRRSPADMHVIGHFHQWNPAISQRFILCPCLCGWDAYARDKLKAEYRPPSQALLIIDGGRITKAIEVFV